jgi:hypothetical protein
MMTYICYDYACLCRRYKRNDVENLNRMLVEIANKTIAWAGTSLFIGIQLNIYFF